MSSALRGIVAGAAGTVALNLATYADMALRGRSSSSAPSKMIDKVTKQLHLPLSPQGVGAQDETTQNRESGLGALLGYVNGLGTGILYGVVRSQFDEVPALLAAPLVGLTAMAASDVPLVSMKLTNPKTWGLSGWLSDAIPHLIYGIVTVATYEAMSR